MTPPKALRYVLVVAVFLATFAAASGFEEIYADWKSTAFQDKCLSGCNLSRSLSPYINNADDLWGASGASVYRLWLRNGGGTPSPSDEYAIAHWAHRLTSIEKGQIQPETLVFKMVYGSENVAVTIDISPDNSTWYKLDYQSDYGSWHDILDNSNMTDVYDILDFINDSDWLNVYVRLNLTTESVGASFTGINLSATLWNASEPIVTNCSNSAHPVAINFTFFNETNSAGVESDMDLAVDILLDNGTVRPMGLDYNNDTFHELCIFQEEESFTANLTAQFYDSDYEPREYYDVSRTLDNTTDDIELYQLHNSDATLWEVETVNEAGSPLENIYIEIERFFPETNSYTELCRMRTDNNGEDSTYTLWYDAFYRFNFTDGFGESYLLTTASKITDSPITYTLSTLGEIAIFEYVNEVDAEITEFDNGNLSITTTDPSNYMTSTCYVVTEKTNMSFDTEINDTCIVGSPTTFETNINTSLHHSITVRMLYGTESFLVYSDIIGPDATVPFGDTGLLFGLVLSITFGMAGTAMGPIGAMFGWLVGYGISLGTGFIEVEDLMGHFVGIATFIMIVIYFINKRREFG